MKKSCLPGMLGVVLLVGAAPGFAQERPSGTVEDDFLNLYFDDKQVVEAATRVAKPMSQVAENVTIITAAEIERMNAHNLDDVLNRVAGVYVKYHAQDFNGNTLLAIHDSSWQQVAVYLDGVKISKATQDLSYVNIVPVRIVKRIEVIKGAASSTWGSALGGVINIITKDTGDTLTVSSAASTIAPRWPVRFLGWAITSQQAGKSRTASRTIKSLTIHPSTARWTWRCRPI